MNTTTYREGWAERQAFLRAIAFDFGVRADATDPVIDQYRARQQQLVSASQDYIAAADAEKRELTTEERKAIGENTAEVERLENEIELRGRVNAQHSRLDEPMGRQTPADSADPLPANNSAPRNSTPTIPVSIRPPGVTARGNGGFRNMADFAMAVRRAVQGSGLDQRLQNALSTYGSEGVGADGGFAVPVDFRNEVMNLVTGEDSIFSRVDAIPTSSNTVTVPVDETTAWGTSGVRVYSRAEAAAMTQSKPALGEVSVKLNEIYALVPLTDELLEDSPMMSRLISTKAGEALQFKLTDYVINGTGSGQPLGIMNAACTVSVAKEGSQAADTIKAINIAKMWSRVPGAVRNRTVWLINQDCEPQMMQMGFQLTDVANANPTGGIPLYVPPGGLSALPYATLMGRPVIATEACATLGDVGDIILAYLPGYFMPYKAGGIKSDVSMHLWFDQSMTAFRWTFRFGGQPWLSAPISRKSGSNTLSHFVTLATR